MTWNEIADRISQMTSEQRMETALFVERDDNDATVWEFGMHVDIYDTNNGGYPIRLMVGILFVRGISSFLIDESHGNRNIFSYAESK